jgi:hypothetical protein
LDFGLKSLFGFHQSTLARRDLMALAAPPIQNPKSKIQNHPNDIPLRLAVE